MAVKTATFSLFTRAWWKASIIRALRTALVAAVPYIPVSYTGGAPLLAVGSVAGLAFILSIVTSLTGLSEADGKSQVYWVAIVERVVKTIAQSLVAGIGTAALLTDVDWPTVVQASVFAGFGSLVLAVIAQLPEAGTPPTLPVTGTTSTGVTDTRAAVTSAPYGGSEATVVNNYSIHNAAQAEQITPDSATSTPASE